MPDRFYCPNFARDQAVRLEGAEAHHLLRVLRKTVGDVVELFDGSGRQATAEIEGITKRTADLRLLDFKETPPHGAEIILASAVPKGDRFRWLVEKATELGVDRLIPLVTERSVVKPGEGKRGKMEQAVIEACKQSGRNRLMQIAEPTSLDAVLELCRAKNLVTLFAHPAGQPLKEVFQKEPPASISLERVLKSEPKALASGPNEVIPYKSRPAASALPLIFAEYAFSNTLLLVGPEGGWTEEEFANAAAAGAVSVSLGANILRIETAAIALAALAALWRDE